VSTNPASGLGFPAVWVLAHDEFPFTEVENLEIAFFGKKRAQ
jgi:hypothetical protein